MLNRVLLCVILIISFTGAAATASTTEQDNMEIIQSLRDRLAEASHQMSSAEFIGGDSTSLWRRWTSSTDRFVPFSSSRNDRGVTMTSVNCSCRDYCLGNCFAIQCAPCNPDDFSFPGGESLCYHPGPLGTGLLCHVDKETNKVTPNACCTREGPTCFLPAGSCCSKGDCSTCGGADGIGRRTDLPAKEIFPWLNTTDIRSKGYRRRRIFSSNNCRFVV